MRGRDTGGANMNRLALLALLLMGCGETADDTSDGTDADTSADTEMGTEADTEAECFPDLDLEYDDDDCLTFAGADDVCGDAQGDVCQFLVGCGLSTDAGQCSIDCTMTTTIACLTDVDVTCLTEAVCADDCDAANACNHPIFIEGGR